MAENDNGVLVVASHDVPVAYRPPFAFGAAPWRGQRPHGETIADIVRSVPNLPREFLQSGTVCINGEIVPRERWPNVRPRPNRAEFPIAVTLHMPAGRGGSGGGSGGGKSTLALVAAFALLIVTAAITGGVLGPGGILGAGGLGVAFGAGGGGALATGGDLATFDL